MFPQGSRRADPFGAPPPFRPIATYGLLGAIGAVFVLQLLTIAWRPALHDWAFVIYIDWYLRPWTLVTSTLAHGGVTHLLFNGLFLYFLGPGLERIVGPKRFVLWFLVAGAVSGVAQVELVDLMGEPRGALGASGALMMVFGTLMILVPNNQILIYGIVPVRMWVAGLGFALLDILGVFNPGNGIGNIAHLSGLALGLLVGWWVKKDLARRGLRIVSGP